MRILLSSLLASLGAAAAIQPLREHPEPCEARFANRLGAGVQACCRGPRLLDTDKTKALAEPITCSSVAPLYDTGLRGRARVSVDGTGPAPVALDPTAHAMLDVKIPARGQTWVLFEQEEAP